MPVTLRKNRTRLIILAALLLLFATAARDMGGQEWFITVLRGLAVGAITFLVAAGLSLIFGLMDVLNLAHGELFMLGAYLGWTVYVRPDTFVDLLTPLTLLLAGLALTPVWGVALRRLRLPRRVARWWPWLALGLGLALVGWVVRSYPITRWNPDVFADSPGTYALSMQQGLLRLPAPRAFEDLSAPLAVVGLLLGGGLASLALAGFQVARVEGGIGRIPWRRVGVAIGLLLIGLLCLWWNDNLTAWLLTWNNAALFLLALSAATLGGFGLGWVIESALIRPLYDRPIYQIMLTLGVGFILIELVRAIWGRTGFTMPKADIFNGVGPNCPAASLNDLLTHHCSTVLLFNGRIRTYNELFIILTGAAVLIAIWLLLQRTRLGMIIRAGVQDAAMVEALGINVRRVFTFVFALGVALAALGGVLAAPSLGLSNDMGTRFLLLALIALAIGGLTSFPGAAAGAVLVGLVQQFIIKYGQLGIHLPFLAEPFKPTPPLVPASTVLLMVIILLFLPNGLFGRSD